MDFLHKREYMNGGDVVIVDCSHRCNVMLMADYDFQNYRRGHGHRYFGGHYERLPARIVVPSDGWWNITLDLGGGRATIQHSIRIVKAA